jgi:hypothetical protein
MRHFSIVGINTAWLSKNEHDRHRLSPGVAILESALRSCADADVRIVLGHHPIDWFDDRVSQQVRSIFGKYGVLYLHGHLHRNEATEYYGAGLPFLALQAGAAFQAREDDVWLNRVLWAELDVDRRTLRVAPRAWSGRYREWSIDGSAFPEAYRLNDAASWEVPLPIPGKPQTPPRLRQLVPGWHAIDAQFLLERRTHVSPDDMIAFFDGRAPRWNVIANGEVNERTAVESISNDIATALAAHENSVHLILGPGGEGKSTTLMQTAARLAARSDLRLLWHADEDARLSIEAVNSLPPDQRYILVSDYADLIARDVFDALRSSAAGDRKLIFLLGCRDSDWVAAGAPDLPWHRFSALRTYLMRGLTLEDASRVVTTWAKFGVRGLGRLDPTDLGDAARTLHASASSEVDLNEGAFLGAMLRTRIGEDLRNHVRDVMDRLRSRVVGSSTLMDAFAYVSVAHSKYLRFLSKAVLAETLGIAYSDVNKKVLKGLGEEAAVARSGEFVLTRHIAIAQTAVSLLQATYDLDPEELLTELVLGAQRAKTKGALIPQLAQWRFLAGHLFDGGERELALRIAMALLQEFPDDSYIRAHTAHLFREADQNDVAARLFRESGGWVLDNGRAFYNEWATVEGNLTRHAVAVWLGVLALSDQIDRRPPDIKTLRVSLAGIGLALGHLRSDYNEREFAIAQGAIADLGLMLPYDAKGVAYFRGFARAAKDFGYVSGGLDRSVQLLEDIATHASSRRETELPNWVLDPSKLTLVGMRMIVEASASRGAKER